MKFEIYQSEGGKFYFRLKASNGQVILSSQGYTAKASAISGAESVAKNAASRNNFEVKTAADGSPFFNLLSAANKQVIGTSQMYSSSAAMEGGIDSVMRTAPEAQIVDLTLEK
ncbi:MAG: YegP family protein [Haliscomenobacter sp.]|nr:YegP family protein [Haliscomenobacter sp.]MBK8877204.1 YegP family protein [Haliscomenobacter sp.]